ncbi:hypothetical protein H310_04604 [Aphanomyces invadans]|uniref:U6 snRNA-associated Sm-like protein LSm8 n=1 Tax=Aphanomyces invadans TaxID=157072 RepID=A0A024UF64_9STRA|nr:hypothetical protein H310_04604 [Aphanomyces invadans]ETW04283.1 hypothetical protein H310_04604 [Aphanomyces invadans]|eukprot:XP_008867239.1 hypothetical protein H310_04604 [Aphanomyces invadans]
MATFLHELVNHMVSVTTNDGRNIIGVLKGYDQCINVILDNSFERVYSMTDDVQIENLGLFIVRGDNIAIIGEVPDNVKEQSQSDTLRAPPMKPVTH